MLWCLCLVMVMETNRLNVMVLSIIILCLAGSGLQHIYIKKEQNVIEVITNIFLEMYIKLTTKCSGKVVKVVFGCIPYDDYIITEPLKP